MLRKLFAVSVLLAATTCFADTLPTFAAVKSALMDGKPIHILTSFSRCAFSDPMMAVKLSDGLYTPDTVKINDDHIATSLTHFTLDNPEYMNKPVKEFVSYKLTTDGNVTLTIHVLSAATYAPLGNAKTVTCKLNTGIIFYD